MPLCKSCHNEVHHGAINIFGYKSTSDGVILDYIDISKKKACIKATQVKSVEESDDSTSDIEVKSELGTKIKLVKSTKKYDDDALKIISETCKTYKTSRKNMCNYLEINHNIKISVSTLTKIINGNY